MEIIRDLLWLWILGALGGTGYILWALFVRDASPVPVGQRPQQVITTRRTPVGAPPVARPAGSAAAPSRVPTAVPPVVAPVGEHQRRGSAPTVKLPSAEPAKDSEDQAAADLFGGLSEARAQADAAPPIHVPAPTPLPIPKDIAAQVVRLEERGFHVGAGRGDITAQPRQTTEGSAPAIKTPEGEAKPGEGKPADGVPAQARGQTAELDDILKRIDAVLSESNAPQSEATLTGPQQQGGHATMPMPMSPPSEKHERKQTDPNQQKLF